MIYLTLFWTFFKIGLFTFGGGYAMLPLIQQYVLGFNWLSEEELVNFVAVSESTPGPFAINIATYVGSSQAGSVLFAPPSAWFSPPSSSFLSWPSAIWPLRKALWFAE